VLLAKAGARKEVELWEWRLEPGDDYHPDPDAWKAGASSCSCSKGSLTLVVGEQSFTIGAGEFFMFASHQPHCLSQ
jgi:hypothetical protein